MMAPETILVTLTIRNTGASSVTISDQGTIDGNTVTVVPAAGLTVDKGDTEVFTFDLGLIDTFAPGAQYQLGLVTAKGTTIVYTATYNP